MNSGISNEDWFVTVGGDGYETVVDPTNPDIVYSQWQYGGLVRYDRASGELIDIQPQEEPGEDAHRWNWDSPLIISPHSPTRLYFACQRLYRSDDHGDSWTAVSPRSQPGHRPRHPAGLRQDPVHRRGGQEQVHLALRQHRRAHRVAPRRGSDLCRHR